MDLIGKDGIKLGVVAVIGAGIFRHGNEESGMRQTDLGCQG